MVERGEVERRRLAPGADQLGVVLAGAVRARRRGQVRDAQQQLLQLGLQRPVLLLGGGDDALQLAGPLDQRRPLVGVGGALTAVATRLDSARASSPRWIAELRAASSFSRAASVQGVAAPGEPAHGVGGGIEQDAWVVHRSRRIAAAVTGIRAGLPIRRWRSAVVDPSQDVARTTVADEEVRRRDRSRSRRPVLRLRHLRRARCSATRSATTSTARSPRSPTREALVEVPTGRRWTYARAARGRRHAWRSGCSRAGRRQGRPGRASGRRTWPSGRWSSTPRPRSARSWSTSTRPTARTSWSTCSTRPASRCWSPRPASRPPTTPR